MDPDKRPESSGPRLAMEENGQFSRKELRRVHGTNSLAQLIVSRSRCKACEITVMRSTKEACLTALWLDDNHMVAGLLMLDLTCWRGPLGLPDSDDQRSRPVSDSNLVKQRSSATGFCIRNRNVARRKILCA